MHDIGNKMTERILDATYAIGLVLLKSN